MLPKKLSFGEKVSPTRAEMLEILLPDTAAKENPLLATVFRAAKSPLYQPVPVAKTLPKAAKEVPKNETGDEEAI